MENNRKTNIPIKSIPVIVEWLIANCSVDEIYFMANLATDRRKFALLAGIFTRLTDYNIHEVFYEKNISSAEELLVFRAAKRGEVAGLKAFQMACQAAKEKIRVTEEDKKDKRKSKEDN